MQMFRNHFELDRYAHQPLEQRVVNLAPHSRSFVEHDRKAAAYLLQTQLPQPPEPKQPQRRASDGEPRRLVKPRLDREGPRGRRAGRRAIPIGLHTESIMTWRHVGVARLATEARLDT